MFGFRSRFNGSDDSGEGKGRINRKRVRIEREVRNSFMRPAAEAFPYFYIQCHQPSSGFYNRRLSMNAIDQVCGITGWIHEWSEEWKTEEGGGCMSNSDGF